MPLYIAIPFLVVFTAFVLRREIAEWRRERRRRAARPAQATAWREAFVAENPDVSPLTQEEIDGFKAFYASLALPAVPAPKRPVRAAGTRIGGPAWRDGEGWPVGRDGEPLEFVAQIDFAELPPLPDFPTTGLLQFFTGSLDYVGADLEDPAGASTRVLWRPDGLEGGKLHPQVGRTNVLSAGLSMTRRPAVHPLGTSDWRIEERLKGQLRRQGIEELDDLLEGDDDDPPRGGITSAATPSLRRTIFVGPAGSTPTIARCCTSPRTAT